MMAKQRETIGECDCVLCSRTVPVHQQINALAMVVCPFCGCKLQAFGGKADALIRGRIKKEAQAAPAPALQPKPAVVPAAPQPKSARLAGTILDMG